MQLKDIYFPWYGLLRSQGDGSGSKFFDPGQVRSIFCGSGWVSHLWFGIGFGKFPLKMSNFLIFSPSLQKNLFRLGQKVPGSKEGWPLIYCGSEQF